MLVLDLKSSWTWNVWLLRLGIKVQHTSRLMKCVCSSKSMVFNLKLPKVICCPKVKCFSKNKCNCWLSLLICKTASLWPKRQDDLLFLGKQVGASVIRGAVAMWTYIHNVLPDRINRFDPCLSALLQEKVNNKCKACVGQIKSCDKRSLSYCFSCCFGQIYFTKSRI